MNFMFNTVTDAGIAGLGIVSDLGIAPGAGLVATALHSIKENCEQIVTHKADCRRLANTAAQLYNLFEEQTKQLEKTPLRPATDEVEQVLLDVREKTLKWASYGRIRAFRYEKTIGEGIKHCHTELENSVRGFQIAAVVSLAAAQKEQMEQMQYNHQEVVERLNQHQEIAERFNKLILTASKDAIIKRGPDPQAEPLLELGHERLREMRDYLNNMTGELRINGQTTTRATFNTTYLRTQDVLSALHTATKLLPNIKSLNGEVVKDGNMPYAGGSFSDVWIGIWLGDRKVALKCLRGIKNTSSTAKRRFENEIKIWSKLQHPNVLSFLGMVTDVGAYLALVSPWQENGNIFNFCQRDKGKNFNRIQLLLGAALGLEYLHSKNVVHGNLKCANILITETPVMDDDGQPIKDDEGNPITKIDACVSDFEMAKVFDEVNEHSSNNTLTRQASARWLAPELVNTIRAEPPSDVFSFAMLMIELFTLQPPFPHLRRDAQVIHRIVVMKERPPRPRSPWVSDAMWQLIQECWNEQGDRRPTMGQVVKRLRELENQPPVTLEPEEEMDTD